MNIFLIGQNWVKTDNFLLKMVLVDLCYNEIEFWCYYPYKPEKFESLKRFQSNGVLFVDMQQTVHNDDESTPSEVLLVLPNFSKRKTNLKNVFSVERLL